MGRPPSRRQQGSIAAPDKHQAASWPGEPGPPASTRPRTSASQPARPPGPRRHGPAPRPPRQRQAEDSRPARRQPSGSGASALYSPASPQPTTAAATSRRHPAGHAPAEAPPRTARAHAEGAQLASPPGPGPFQLRRNARKPRAERQVHGQGQRRHALMPDRGKPPKPVSPGPPIPQPWRSLRSREKIQPARKGALRALTPKDGRPSPHRQRAAARVAAVPKTRAQRPLRHSPRLGPT
jgi:hypothetical protein